MLVNVKMLDPFYLVLHLISYRTVGKLHDREKVEHHGIENKLIKTQQSVWFSRNSLNLDN